MLHGDAAHHAGRVLRAEPGQLYELSDGQAVWLGRIERVSRSAVEFALLERLPGEPPRLRQVLLLAIVKFDRFEWALEKATELGVAEIVPLAAARSEKPLLAAATKRAARWKKILLGSAQQSRRLQPPLLHAPVRPREAFRQAEAVVKILLSERPGVLSLRAALGEKGGASVALAVGPEGGWTEEEFAAAREAAFGEVSLGTGVLRTETAVTAALASLNYALGQ